MTTYLIPVFSILWGNIFLGESVTLIMVVGCILVLLGVGLTTKKSNIDKADNKKGPTIFLESGLFYLLVAAIRDLTLPNC